MGGARGRARVRLEAAVAVKVPLVVGDGAVRVVCGGTERDGLAGARGIGRDTEGIDRWRLIDRRRALGSSETRGPVVPGQRRAEVAVRAVMHVAPRGDVPPRDRVRVGP